MGASSRGSAPCDAWLAGARAGHAGDFWRLADSYRLYLKAVAAGLIGGRLAGKVDASDVVQEGLKRALERMSQFRGQDLNEWRVWVLSIIRRAALWQLRYWLQGKRDVRQERRLANGSGGCHEPAADSSSPSEKALRRERAARLMALLEQLPPDYLNVLRLRDFEDLPFAEVGLRRGRSEGAVRQLWHRAVRQLRDDWGDDA